MAGISRRAVLIGTGAGLVALSLCKAIVDREDRALEELARFLGDNSYAGAIGQEVLRVSPQDYESLHKYFSARMAGAGRNRSIDEVLVAVLSEDFRAAKVIEIGGWIVADVEAKAYAFLYLHSKSK